MRVLHIGLERSWRGGENQVFLLIQGLKDHGFECHVAYPTESRGFEKFKEVAPVLGLPSTGGYNLKNIKTLSRYITENNIELVDAHSAGAHSLALAVKIMIPHLKVVVHRRVDNEIKDRFLTKKKYLSPNVNRFVAISDCIKRMLIAYGVDEDRVSVVKSAIDIHKYDSFDRDQCRKDLLAKLKMNDPGFLLGNASAFTEQKGIDVLIQSLKPLKDKNMKFHCVLAGDGPMLDEMKALAKNLSLSDHITFLGFSKEVPKILSALDLLVMSSNNEGLGTLALDGIAAGANIIASRVGGLPEIVIHGETGLSIPKGDHQALAKEIETIMVDRDFAATLSRNAKDYIANNFSLQSMVKGNLKIYRSL